jgi:NosR/NirI family nitrous oxide reductase transcriptional regulator
MASRHGHRPLAGGPLHHLLRRYADWLHLRWPAGTVEPLPALGQDGRTNVAGVYVAGDLTGVPLLKLAIDSGARAVRALAADLPRERDRALTDLVVIGAGPAGSRWRSRFTPTRTPSRRPAR